MKHLRKILTLGVTMLSLVFAIPIPTQAQTQMSKVKRVWVILMENANWTGDNSGGSFGAPDIKGNPLAPYINGTLLHTAAHAERYFNPPGNHPSLPNYLWLEAGTNFGILADILPHDPTDPTDSADIKSTQHLVTQLDAKGISWKAYAEPDFGNPVFTDCPQDFSEIDVNHLAFVYFADVTNGINGNPSSPNCIAHVRPYDELPTDLANHTSARYNFITPNLCDDGHEGVSPCEPPLSGPLDNVARADTWLKENVPLITQSKEYCEGGALFILWDEAEDNDPFSDGPIGMFLLSPFAKGKGHREYQNFIHYDHSSTLKTLQEIFHVQPLLGAAADPATKDLSDLFRKEGEDEGNDAERCGCGQ